MKYTFKTCLLILLIASISSQSYATSIISPGLNTLPYEEKDGVKIFRLVAMPVTQKIYDNSIDKVSRFIKPENRLKGFKEMPFTIPKKEVAGYGYNGTIPGPTIIVTEGDRVRIIVDNKLPEPTTVHWHGLIVPNSQDGTGGTTQPVIPPGGRYTYEFTIRQTGSFMYHPGFNDTKQVRYGMGGMFIALPKDKKVADKDFSILLQMFTVPAKSNKPVIFSMDPNWFTFNGLVMPNFPVLEVNEGDKVRIRFGNLAETSHPIHLHGYSFNVVGTEGGPIQKSAQWPAATVTINPGETRDIEFIANNPGIWRLHCHKILHITNDTMYWKKRQPGLGLIPLGGMFTYLYVNPKQK